MADRYAFIITSLDSVRAKFDACAELGLYYVVRNDPMNEPPEIVKMAVFFDAAGRDAYLAGQYEEAER